MSRMIMRFVWTSAIALGIGFLMPSASHAQACLGDCNMNGVVTAGELTKITAIILECDGAAAGCAAVPGGCTAADKNGNGIISAGELTNVISNILNFATGCPPTTPGATNTPAATHTPVPSNTPTPTFTIPPSPTPTATTVVAAVCGDGVVEGDEECDQGGTCIGGDNAGTACTSEAQCIGHGVCTEGPHIGAACADDSACPGGGKCIHCKTFGGNGCAANCTLETDVPFTLVPGVAQKSPPAILSGSGAFVHDGIIQLALPLSGSQVLTVGKVRNNRLTYIVKAASLHIPQIAVSTLACACTRGVAGKSCGGTLFEEDGTTLSTGCSDAYTAGASLCNGKKPCAFVNGPGNSASGLVGCDGLEGVNLSFTQQSTASTSPPPPPTPRPGSGPAVITLSGSGGPGSTVVLNTSAIGTTTAAHVAGKVCQGVAPCAATSDFGADCMFCTDDDPQSARGVANTLPQVTGTATAEIFTSGDSSQADGNIGPFTVTGNPISCSMLTANPPSLTGISTAGAFTALNQPSTHDIVVTNNFFGQ